VAIKLDKIKRCNVEKSYESLVRIQDNQSALRKSFLKKWFANNYDGLRFFIFLAKLTRIPIIGRYILRPTMETYYHNFEPGSHILPRHEIEAVINASTHLSIDPCICRIYNQNCDAPLYTCLRINFAASIRQEETGRGITKQEALKIVRNARKHGLILVLEHCIRPYQYNICMCCTCCCVPKQFRYQFGMNVYNNGPYFPTMNQEKCQLCGKCIPKCPVEVIYEANQKISVKIEECLGCGVCEDTCPNNAITMEKSRDGKRDESEPGKINLFFKRIYLKMILIPQAVIFRLCTGSQQYKVELSEPREKDVYEKKI
jgi:NAD-dependent dihydropyrimidine dehydrogenase PreA subunit